MFTSLLWVKLKPMSVLARKARKCQQEKQQVVLLWALQFRQRSLDAQLYPTLKTARTRSTFFTVLETRTWGHFLSQHLFPHISLQVTSSHPCQPQTFLCLWLSRGFLLCLSGFGYFKCKASTLLKRSYLNNRRLIDKTCMHFHIPVKSCK